jgi:hypothetical protein
MRFALFTALCLPLLSFAADEVKLVSARSSDCPPVSGCYRSLFLDATIEVKNLAPSKKVELVYHNPTTNSWQTAQARYVGPSQAGRELWQVRVDQNVDQFALSYSVAGQTYWDNNGGIGVDYRPSRYAYDAIVTYPYIADAEAHLSTGAIDGLLPTDAVLSGSVLVDHVASGKNVKVVYTDNNWATVIEAPAVLQQILPSGVEYWSWSVPLAGGTDTTKVQVAFSYRWNNGETWDNNYNKNYRLNAGVLSR